MQKSRLLFAWVGVSPRVSLERQRGQERPGYAIGRAMCIPVHDKWSWESSRDASSEKGGRRPGQEGVLGYDPLQAG